MGMRVAATVLTVAGLYVVNFLVVAVAILLPIDSLSGEISSGVIQTLASKPVDRAAIVVGKWLAYLGMTAAYLALMGGGVVLEHALVRRLHAPAVLAPMGLMLLGAAVMLSITIAGGVRFPRSRTASSRSASTAWRSSRAGWSRQGRSRATWPPVRWEPP